VQLARGQLASSRNFPICNHLKNTSTPLWKRRKLLTQYTAAAFSPQSTKVAHEVHPICTESSPVAGRELWWAYPPKQRSKLPKIEIWNTRNRWSFIIFRMSSRLHICRAPLFEDFLAEMLKQNRTCTWQSAHLHMTECWLAPDKSAHLHMTECSLALDRVLTCTCQRADLHLTECSLAPDRMRICTRQSAHLHLTECSLAPYIVLTCTWQSADLHPTECAPAPERVRTCTESAQNEFYVCCITRQQIELESCSNRIKMVKDL